MKKLAVLVCLSVAQLAFAVSSFELPQMNTESHSIYKSTDHTNGIFVVEAYFNTCPYCNDNATNVDALADDFASEPRVQVLDVGIDRHDSDYSSWIAKHHPNHPVLKDSSRALIKQLGTTGYPSTYVIDGSGNVVFTSVGAWDSGTAGEIKNAVNALLKP